METNRSVFETLNAINVNGKTEKKNGLTYLSWVWAWGEVKKLYPNATYTVYERETQYGLVHYFTDGMTCWVKTGVTIEGLEHIECLPIMDFKNQSIPLEKIKSTDVNKAIQRSITKALARHGLALYVYSGEDLPEEEKKQLEEEMKQEEEKQKTSVYATEKQIEIINGAYSEAEIKTMLTRLKISSLSEITVEQASKMIKARKGK